MGEGDREAVEGAGFGFRREPEPSSTILRMVPSPVASPGEDLPFHKTCISRPGAHVSPVSLFHSGPAEAAAEAAE
ncbi:hypothetical protein GCM10009116_19790 [Brevundimonas basaltis]